MVKERETGGWEIAQHTNMSCFQSCFFYSCMLLITQMWHCMWHAYGHSPDMRFVCVILICQRLFHWQTNLMGTINGKMDGRRLSINIMMKGKDGITRNISMNGWIVWQMNLHTKIVIKEEVGKKWQKNDRVEGWMRGISKVVKIESRRRKERDERLNGRYNDSQWEVMGRRVIKSRSRIRWIIGWQQKDGSVQLKIREMYCNNFEATHSYQLQRSPTMLCFNAAYSGDDEILMTSVENQLPLRVLFHAFI